MSILAVTADLMVQSWIGAAASHVGESVTVAANLDAIRQRCLEHPPRLILVDLAAPGLDLPGLVVLAAEVDPPAGIVAFGPHVQKERLAAARAAGCQVFSRGQFQAQIDAILRPA